MRGSPLPFVLCSTIFLACGGGGGGEIPDGGEALTATPKLVNPGDQVGYEDTVGAIPFPEGGVPGTGFKIDATNGALFRPVTGAGTQAFAAGKDGGQNVLFYAPKPDLVGESTFTFTLATVPDGEVLDAVTFKLRILPVNDAPLCDPIFSLTLDAGMGASGVVTGIGPGGGADEVGQTVTVSVDAGDLSYFDELSITQPAGGNDAGSNRASTLSFQGAPGKTGSVEVTVVVEDGEDGGRTERPFTITFL